MRACGKPTMTKVPLLFITYVCHLESRIPHSTLFFLILLSPYVHKFYWDILTTSSRFIYWKSLGLKPLIVHHICLLFLSLTISQRKRGPREAFSWENTLILLWRTWLTIRHSRSHLLRLLLCQRGYMSFFVTEMDLLWRVMLWWDILWTSTMREHNGLLHV